MESLSFGPRLPTGYNPPTPWKRLEASRVLRRLLFLSCCPSPENDYLHVRMSLPGKDLGSLAEGPVHRTLESIPQWGTDSWERGTGRA